IRGELIMKQNTFQNKYSKTYRNARNMIPGLLGAKTAREGYNDIDFVAYEIVSDNPEKLSIQLQNLKKMGFLVVKYTIIDLKNEKSFLDILSKIYLQAKDESLYDLDGLVLQPNIEYDRVISGLPDYQIAFKMPVGESIYETEVIKVEWNVSKYGQIKPVLIL